MSECPWKKKFPHLKDSQESLSDLLTTGKIPVADYMQWASDYYKIPHLADNFFQQFNNFDLIKNNPHPDWNSSCFPVNEWQGVLYIGCLEPRPLELQKKHCFVLCSPIWLTPLWSRMAPQNATPAAPVSVAPEPKTVDNSTVAPIILGPAATTNTPPATANTVAPKKEAAQEAPKETSTAPSAFPTSKFSFDDLAPILKTDTPAETSPLSPSATDTTAAAQTHDLLDTTNTKTVSEGLSFADISIVSKEEPVETPEPTIGNTVSKIVNTATAPKAPKHSSVKDEVTFNQKINTNQFDIPEITSFTYTNTSIIQMPQGEFTNTNTIMPFPEKNSQFTFIRTVFSQQVILDAHSKIQDNTNPQDALVSAFRILKDYYKKIMWIVRDQKGLAFPIACNSTWDFTESAWNHPMNFNIPNPFRIAKFTQKPFHGPVHSNTASDTFFADWNNSQYPDFFTVMPVLLHGKVFGYVIGCDRGEHFSAEQSLVLMESVCNELMITFVKIYKNLEKAS